MDKEYIERGALLKALNENSRPWAHYIDAIFVAEKLPIAANVVEVKHGWWTEKDNPEYDCVMGLTLHYHTYICSECEGETVRHFNYCPNCGAKMDDKKLPTWIPRDSWELGCEYECPYCGEMIDIPHGGIMPHKCCKCKNEIGVK